MTLRTITYGLLIGALAGLIELTGKAFHSLPQRYFHIAATALVVLGTSVLIYVRNHKQEGRMSAH
jgi:hypothetical protein